MTDATVAAVARRLAAALRGFARDRRDDDKKAVAQGHADLCAEVRAEEEEAAKATGDQPPVE